MDNFETDLLDNFNAKEANKNVENNHNNILINCLKTIYETSRQGMIFCIFNTESSQQLIILKRFLEQRGFVVESSRNNYLRIYW